jgi:hypothetical protein
MDLARQGLPMDDSTSQFLCTGYARDITDGTLSIVSVDESSIRVSGILIGAPAVRQKLADGQSHQEVIDGLKGLQHLTKVFPISALQRIRWNDYNHEVVFEYEEEGRTKQADAFINSEEERTHLSSVLQDHFTEEFRYEERPAGVLKVAWAQFFGAFLALVGTVIVGTFWDPARFARVRGGWLFLALGRSVCILAGIAIVGGCLLSAWLAVRKQPLCHECVVRD